MICPKCGANVEDNNKFCTYCGEKLPQEEIETLEEEPKEEIKEEIKEEKPLQEPNPSNNTDTSFVDEKPQKSKLGLILCLLFVLLIIGGIVVYLLFPQLLVNEKKVVEKETSLVFSNIRKVIEETEKNTLDFDLEKESLGFSGDIKLNSDLSFEGFDLSRLGNYSLSFNGVIDKPSDKASTMISLLKNNKDYIVGKAYLEKENLYLSLGDLYSKILSMDIDEGISTLEFSTESNTKDINKLLEKTEKILNKNLDKDYITKSKEENLVKVSYSFGLKREGKKLIDSYLKDKEVLELISKITNKEIEDVKEELQYSKEELDYTTGNLTINLYLKGISTVKRIELISEDNKIVIDKEKNNYNYKLVSSNEELFHGTYNSKDKVLTVINDLMKATIQGKDNHLMVDMDINLNGEKVTVKLDFKNTLTSTTEEDKFSMIVNYDNNLLSLEGNMKIEKGSKVEEMNIENAIDIDSVSDAELEQIGTKLGNKLLDIVKEIAPSLTDSTLYRKIESSVHGE